MQGIARIVHRRNTAARHAPRWAPVLLIFCSLVAPSRGQHSIGAQAAAAKPEFLIPLCMIAGTHAREIAGGSEAVKAQVLTELRIDAADWNALSTACQTVFAGVDALAREARAAQTRAGVTRLDSASIADYNRRRQAVLTQNLSDLQRSLSASGWRALSGLMKELEANTTSARIP